MNKLLSILISLVFFISATTSTGVMASEQKLTKMLFKFEENTDTTMYAHPSVNSILSWDSGCAGKPASDKSARIVLKYYDDNGNIAKTNSGFLSSNLTWTKDEKQSFSKYIVFEAKVSLHDADDVYFATNQNKRITSSIKDKLTHYWWNSIMTVVNIEDGSTITYVNEQKVDEGTTVFGTENNNQIRLVINDDNLGGTAFIDDVRVYEANYIPQKNEVYTSENEILSTSGVVGDYTYFDNRYCDVSQTASYKNLDTRVSGSGKVILSRIEEHKETGRNDNIVLSVPDSESESAIDISLERSINKSDRYSYINMEVDLIKNSFGTVEHIFEIYDSVSMNSFKPIIIMPEGEIVFSDGNKAEIKAEIGKTINILLALNLKDRIYDVYIDGVKVGNKIALPPAIYNANKVALAIKKGCAGELNIDSLKITGTVNPVINGEYEKTDIFSDSSEEKTFLEDKTAIFVPAKKIYADGEKIDAGTIYFDEKELEIYTTAEKLQILTGIDGTPTSDIKIIDGETLYATKQYAELCGLNVVAVKNGLFIISENSINLDYDNWDYLSFRIKSGRQTQINAIDIISSFLLYDRPDKERLREDFSANSDINEHPRVLLKSSDFDRLRNLYTQGTSVDYNYIVSKMIDTADSLLEKDVEEYKFDDSFRTLSTAESLLDKFRYWGYAYQITKDIKYVERAYEEFEAIASFPDFNTAHIIDTGEYAAAVAFGYDWMYEGFTVEQHKFIEDFVMKKILRPLASGLYGGLTSSAAGGYSSTAYVDATNFNSIVNGGLLTASIAFMECDEEFCLQTISDSLKSAEYAFMCFAPSGGWVESLPYWNFSMQYLIYQNESCEKVFGTSYGLAESHGFSNTANYAVAAIGQQGINNYHDSGAGFVNKNTYSYDTFAYLGKRFNIPEAAAMRAYSVKSGSFGFFDALYLDTDIFENHQEVLDNLNTASKIEGIELFSVRDSFNKNTGKFYFSTHFGPTTCYHSQNDVGTFVLDMLGERWAYDLGADDYLLQNEQGYSQSELYRYRTEGHNTFTVNNSTTHNQTENMFFDIDEWNSNDSSAYMIAKLPYLYKDVPQMKMGYFIGDNKSSLTIRSELTCDKNSEIYWFMHLSSDTEVSVSGNSATLTKNGKQIKIDILCSNTSVEIGEMPAEPLDNSPSPEGQASNREYKKLYVKFNARKDENENITIKISNPQVSCEPINDTSLDSWQLE